MKLFPVLLLLVLAACDGHVKEGVVDPANPPFDPSPKYLCSDENGLSHPPTDAAGNYLPCKPGQETVTL